MTKILVVDDEADLELLIKQKFRQKIREETYRFIFAVNGKDALLQLEQHPDVELVLSDINMPEMDGLTLLSKLNQQNALLKAVIISAYGDMDNIRTAMNLGAFDFITKPINFTDLEVTIEKTIRHVAQIRETIQAIRENNIMKMYVDETVINFMVGREVESSLMVNETIEATVAFIDLCGFTAISESEPPDRVIQLLNRYFDIMAKEIVSQGGVIDKFIGDAILAVFRGELHLDRAMDACLAVRKSIRELPPETGKNVFTPQVSIGINSGEMVCGNIGSATLRRLDYTVIGDVVNTASRLQTIAQPGQVLITEYAFNRIRESFQCAHLGAVALKNKANPTVLYEVLA